MIPVHIIVALDEKLGIGIDGNLPWNLSGDLRHFRDVTCTTQSPKKQNVVLMGRKTWESIPKQFQPLVSRINIVLTRNPGLFLPEGVLTSNGFDQVLEMSNSEQLKNIIETIFVIGGQQVYNEALKYSQCQKLYITQVHAMFACDTFFPEFRQDFEKINSSAQHNEGALRYHFEEYERKQVS